MPAPPLTHHEILGLVEPFTRSGRHVDLAASDRAARKLVFKPVARAVEPVAAPELHETLQMECHERGQFTLTRLLTHPSGVQATLKVRGLEPAAVLAQVGLVAPAQQFESGPGFTIVRNYDVHLPEGAAGSPLAAPLILSRGTVQLDGLTLSMEVLPLRGVAADIVLTPTSGDKLELPDDLLAVLGWDWARLAEADPGWKTRLRLRGSTLRRSRTAERALAQVARHLVRVLGEAPRQYHQRHRWARWGVVFRRAIPTLTALGMILIAALLPRFTEGKNAGLWMALQYVPIAALALAFGLQEMARFEIPRPPRRTRAARWREAAGPADGRV